MSWWWPRGPKLTDSKAHPVPEGITGAPGRFFTVIMARTGTHRVTGRSSTMSDLAVLLSTRNIRPGPRKWADRHVRLHSALRVSSVYVGEKGGVLVQSKPLPIR